jgi:hypothetical protein
MSSASISHAERIEREEVINRDLGKGARVDRDCTSITKEQGFSPRRSRMEWKARASPYAGSMQTSTDAADPADDYSEKQHTPANK